MRPRTILIVEDDAAVRAAVAERLTEEDGLAAEEAGSAAEAEARLSGAGTRVDAVLLDIGLPDGDGRELCARLRKGGLGVPIIMLTGADGEEDVVRGLDAGASDYVVKPFRPDELLARLRAQLRVFDSSEAVVFAIGPYLFRPAAKLLLEQPGGRRIRLTDKESAMLKRLCRAGGRPVPRQVLLDEVWGYSAAATTHTLETHVYRLRQKMESDPGNARLLLTEGGGYRLDAAPGRVAAA